MFSLNLKFFLGFERSGVDPTPEGSLTLVSILLWGVVNRGLDILDNLTKLILLNIRLSLVNFSIKRTFKEIHKQLLKTYKNYLI